MTSHIFLFILLLSVACSNSTVAEWTRETSKNIDLCKQEIKCAMSLRSYVEILFKQVVEDISDQFNRTNESFRTRMEEIRYTKMKLESLHCGTANQVNFCAMSNLFSLIIKLNPFKFNNQISAYPFFLLVLIPFTLFSFNFHLFCNLHDDKQNKKKQKVNDLTRNITKLEKELAEKERYVALSQMRLGNRAQRIGIELCKDKAHDTLMRELCALKDTYTKLIHMIDQV